MTGKCKLGRALEPDESGATCRGMPGQKATDQMSLWIEDEPTIQPKIRGRQTLAELLEQTDFGPTSTAEDETWLVRVPVGRELI